MSSKTETGLKKGPGPFISTGFYLAVIYWIFEAVVDSFIENQSILERLIPPETHELWMRSFAALVIFGFGCYAHWMHLRLRTARSVNEEAAWLLRNALSKTIRGNIPYCVWCKKIRDEHGLWLALDKFVSEQTEAKFSAGICDSCREERDR